MEINLKEITESKWFNLYDKCDDLTTEEFITNLVPNIKLNILIQYVDEESIAIYGVIKGKGLYGFTTLKNHFFDKFITIQLKTVNGCNSFIINDKQSINSFINVLLEFFKNNNINLKKDVDIVYYQKQISNLLK